MFFSESKKPGAAPRAQLMIHSQPSGSSRGAAPHTHTHTRLSLIFSSSHTHTHTHDSLSSSALFIPARGGVQQIAWQRAEQTPSRAQVRGAPAAAGRCPAGSAPTRPRLGSCLRTPRRWSGTLRPGFQAGRKGTVPRDTCCRLATQAIEDFPGTQTSRKTPAGKQCLRMDAGSQVFSPSPPTPS